MRKGCCLGCGALLVVLVALLFAGGYYVGNMGLLVPSPENDTLAFLGKDSPVLVQVDLKGPEIGAMLDDGLQIMPLSIAHGIMPYQAALGIRPLPGEGKSSAVFALSTQRLGGLLELKNDPERWHWWVPQVVTQTATEKNGLWVVRSDMPITRRVAAEWDERWKNAKDAGKTAHAVEAEKGHAFQILIDNHRGEGYLALEPVLASMLGQYAGLHNERGIIGGDWIGLDAGQWASVFSRINDIQIAGDFKDNDTLKIFVDVEMASESDKDPVLFMMMSIRRALFLAWLQRGMALDGEFNVEGRNAGGTLMLTGVHQGGVAFIRGTGY